MQDLAKNSTLTPQKSVSSIFFCNVALAGWLYPVAYGTFYSPKHSEY